MNKKEIIIKMYNQLTEDIEKPMKPYQWELIRTPLYNDMFNETHIPKSSIRRIINEYRMKTKMNSRSIKIE